jgi:aspartate/methionine/tyrosine aminotransferase
MLTSGATEGVADCMLALIEPDDEVILIEPLYDCYLSMVKRAGGIPRLVRIKPPNWILNIQVITDSFSNKPKLILLNSSHNPSGKVFTNGESQTIANLVIKHDAYAICDEVCEHLIYDGLQHKQLMTFDACATELFALFQLGRPFP